MKKINSEVSIFIEDGDLKTTKAAANLQHYEKVSEIEKSGGVSIRYRTPNGLDIHYRSKTSRRPKSVVRPTYAFQDFGYRDPRSIARYI